MQLVISNFLNLIRFDQDQSWLSARPHAKELYKASDSRVAKMLCWIETVEHENAFPLALWASERERESEREAM